MPRLETSAISCGVWELSKFASYKEPADALKRVGDALKGIKAPFIVFTGVIGGEKGNYSERLAAFITNTGLGTVIPSSVLPNSSGNDIRFYIWELDHKALAGWLEAEHA